MRRILGFSAAYPSARRVMLATNYRCPRVVVEASRRLIAANAERFAKEIRPGPGAAPGIDAIEAWSTAGTDWPAAMAAAARRADATGNGLCFLSRTRSELLPVLLALVRAGVRHHAAVPLLVDADPVVQLVDAARASPDRGHPFHVLRRLRAARGWDRGGPTGDQLSDDDHAAIEALLGWTVGFPTTEKFVAAFDAARSSITALRDRDAPVELTTVHGSKGREWETVVIIGFEADRMPNRRSIVDADDPDRAMEEERRLAYVALTRATRRLVLAFDPARPSPFLGQMGLAAR